MLTLNLQQFGGRGQGSGSGSSLGGGGGNAVDSYKDKGNIVEYAEKHPESRDSIGEYVSAIEDLHDTGEFRDVATQLQKTFVAETTGAVLAFYGRADGMAINEMYLDADKMNNAYDREIKKGFHPSRGDKSGVFATMSHELGHAVSDKIAQQKGMTLDNYCKNVMLEVTKKLKVNATNVAKGISGYAGHSDAECIAEAVSDVRCNGSKASKYSTEIYNILKRDYKA